MWSWAKTQNLLSRFLAPNFCGLDQMGPGFKPPVLHFCRTQTQPTYLPLLLCCVFRRHAHLLSRRLGSFELWLEKELCLHPNHHGFTGGLKNWTNLHGPSGGKGKISGAQEKCGAYGLIGSWEMHGEVQNHGTKEKRRVV